MVGQADEPRFAVHFEGLSVAEANKAAVSLENALLNLGQPGLRTELQKTRGDTQDFGATIVLVLGTGASVAIAKGIADWLRRRADTASLVILEVGTNRVIAKGTATQGFDAAGVAKALAQASRHRDG